MNANRIEQILQEVGYRYTKEINSDHAIEERFALPFESSFGVIRMNVFVSGNDMGAYTFLRTLDSVRVKMSKVQFLKELLRLNSQPSCARIQLWLSDREDEDVEWIVVDARVPFAGMTPGAFKTVVDDVVSLAENVYQHIASYSASSQTESLPAP